MVSVCASKTPRMWCRQSVGPALGSDMVPLTQPKTRLSFLAVVNADARAFEGFLPALLALCETGGRRAYWTLLARRGALESP